MLVDHYKKIGEKIRISGGGRCNFTNINTNPNKFLSQNPKFVRSALKAIEDVAHKYNSFGKKIKLRHLTKDCHKLLSKTGQLVVDSDDDPDYSLAVDYGVKLKIFGK